MKISLDNNLEFLYQWDIDRKVIITGAALDQEVHFATKDLDEALVIKPKEENGSLTCNIPNILLQDTKDIVIYLYDGYKTTFSKTYKIIARKKPADYIYKETDVSTYEKLTKELKEMIATRANGIGYSGSKLSLYSDGKEIASTNIVTDDYRPLQYKPSINDVVLEGNKGLKELGIQPAGEYLVDKDYVHTDNNYTNEEKEKLASLENYNDTEIRNIIDNNAAAAKQYTDESLEVAKKYSDNSKKEANDYTDTKNNELKDYTDRLLQSNNAMLFKNVINSNDELPENPNIGWTYKVGTEGIYAGEKCEVGDLIIYTETGWAFIQANEDGIVTNTSESNTNNFAVFKDATGKTIQDSGINKAAVEKVIEQSHTHENKDKLDTYTQTESELITNYKNYSDNNLKAAKEYSDSNLEIAKEYTDTTKSELEENITNLNDELVDYIDKQDTSYSVLDLKTYDSKGTLPTLTGEGFNSETLNEIVPPTQSEDVEIVKQLQQGKTVTDIPTDLRANINVSDRIYIVGSDLYTLGTTIWTKETSNLQDDLSYGNELESPKISFDGLNKFKLKSVAILDSNDNIVNTINLNNGQGYLSYNEGFYQDNLTASISGSYDLSDKRDFNYDETVSNWSWNLEFKYNLNPLKYDVLKVRFIYTDDTNNYTDYRYISVQYLLGEPEAIPMNSVETGTIIKQEKWRCGIASKILRAYSIQQFIKEDLTGMGYYSKDYSNFNESGDYRTSLLKIEAKQHDTGNIVDTRIENFYSAVNWNDLEDYENGKLIKVRVIKAHQWPDSNQSNHINIELETIGKFTATIVGEYTEHNIWDSENLGDYREFLIKIKDLDRTTDNKIVVKIKVGYGNSYDTAIQKSYAEHHILIPFIQLQDYRKPKDFRNEINKVFPQEWQYTEGYDAFLNSLFNSSHYTYKYLLTNRGLYNSVTLKYLVPKSILQQYNCTLKDLEQGLFEELLYNKNNINKNNQLANNLDNVKQDKLISGENIKTINNESILGSGNFELSESPITVVNESEYTVTKNGLYYSIKEGNLKLNIGNHIFGFDVNANSLSLINYTDKNATWIGLIPPTNNQLEDTSAVNDYSIVVENIKINNDGSSEATRSSFEGFATIMDIIGNVFDDVISQQEAGRLVTTKELDEETGITTLNTSSIGNGLKLENQELSIDVDNLDISEANFSYNAIDGTKQTVDNLSQFGTDLMELFDGFNTKLKSTNWNTLIDTTITEDTEHYTISNSDSNEYYIWLSKDTNINTGIQGSLTINLFGTTITLGNLETDSKNILVHIIKQSNDYALLDWSTITPTTTFGLSNNRNFGLFPTPITNNTITIRTSAGNISSGTKVKVWKR